jgi:hypothetical protein
MWAQQQSPFGRSPPCSAKAGCSANEIASISGHATLKEVQRYTIAADQARLARNAMAKTAARAKTRTDQPLSNGQ